MKNMWNKFKCLMAFHKWIDKDIKHTNKNGLDISVYKKHCENCEMKAKNTLIFYKSLFIKSKWESDEDN